MTFSTPAAAAACKRLSDPRMFSWASRMGSLTDTWTLIWAAWCTITWGRQPRMSSTVSGDLMS